MDKVALFIPTYNVEKNISRVMQLIPVSIIEQVEKIYIFDNMSSDNTLSLIRNYRHSLPEPLKVKIEIFRNEENYTLGGSTQLAFGQAIQDKMSYLICMHSDGQANPEDLPKFFAAFAAGDFDFVLGSRMSGSGRVENYSGLRLFGNRFFAWLQGFILGHKNLDIGAFIGFNLKTVEQLSYRQIKSDMGYHPHLILLAAKANEKKLRIKEFPIDWGRVESTNINIFTYSLIHLSRIIKILMGMNTLMDRPSELKSNLDKAN